MVTKCRYIFLILIFFKIVPLPTLPSLKNSFNKNKKSIIISSVGLSLLIIGIRKRDFIKKNIKIIFSSQSKEELKSNEIYTELKDLQIIPFDPEKHFEALSSLIIENKDRLYSSFTEQEVKEDIKKFKNIDYSSEKNKKVQYVHIAMHKDVLAGFIYFEPREIDKKEKIGYINLLAVSQKFRKKGIGEKLLKSAEKKLIETVTPKLLRLHANYKNTPAINLYKKMGFAVALYDETNSFFSSYQGCYMTKKLESLNSN